MSAASGSTIDAVSAAHSASERESVTVSQQPSEKQITVFDKEPICTGGGLDCYDSLFWGPYLSERQWGTVREDSSSDDSCWSNTTFESAHKYAYSYGEDGLLGVSDKYGLLCASIALWNGQDSMLKERLFGLSGKEGNHGEDVKELYYYLDNTPDHRYMHALYKYPQSAFPYEALRGSGRSIEEPEFEITDTGVFDDNQYWDIHVEYAKPSSPHLICKYTAVNRSSATATLQIIPQFYFRNTWKKNGVKSRCKVVPKFQQEGDENSVNAEYELGSFRITFHHPDDVIFNELLFTNNESVEEEPEAGSGLVEMTNEKNQNTASNNSNPIPQRRSTIKPVHRRGMSMAPTVRPRLTKMLINKAVMWKKDAFHRHIIHQSTNVLRDQKNGTKVGAWMTCEVPPLGKACVFWQITPVDFNRKGFTTIKKLNIAIQSQKQKADDLYLQVIPKGLSLDQASFCRQALSGLLWSKQFYFYNGEEKINELFKKHGEQYFYSGPGSRKFQWKHLDCEDILLMPDKWEFPWFASWDLAIQASLVASLDLDLAKRQILIMLSDRYMHPNGQIPGCEFNFSDANPPLMAWAVWKIHQHEKPWHLDFIKAVYPRLLINYQWWHRMDPTNSHLFGNGFMGLDNISAFDRSQLPKGMKALKQADATGWMALFALNMLQLTLKQCQYDHCLTDMAIRFLSDFLAMAKAINADTEHGGLWHLEDNFYYDLAQFGRRIDVPVRVRSWTGLIPLFACAKISLKFAPGVKLYLMNCDKALAPYVCKLGEDDFFFTLVPYIKMKSVLHRAFAEKEFLSPFGIRSVSKLYNTIPLNFDVKGTIYTMTFQAGESDMNMYGGNSNWRGPIWLCLNYLFVECLERYSELNQIFTHPLSMDYPSALPLSQRKPFLTIVQDLCERILSIFTSDFNGQRPVHGNQENYLESDWHGLALFYEYYNSETGRGCGASHQTGWSALYVEFAKKLHNLKYGTATKKK